MAEKNLRTMEQELDEREAAIRLAENELLHEEGELDSLEGRFGKRRLSISNLVTHLREQEESLRRRAATMGDSAADLVNTTLGGTGADDLVAGDDTSQDEDRIQLIDRREELLSARTILLEDRQASIAQRRGEVEEEDEHFEATTSSLLSYEEKLANALRSLIRNSGEWEVVAARLPNETAVTPVTEITEPEPPKEELVETEEELPIITEPAQENDALPILEAVVPTPPAAPDDDASQEPTAAPDDDISFISPHSEAEDDATRQREEAEEAEEGDYPITLEVDLGAGQGHAFFRYGDDEPDELPGLFVATSQRMSEGREVKLEMIVTQSGRITTKGVVSWLQNQGDGDGPTGMGVDIVDLTPADMEHVSAWLKDHDMMVV